MDVLADVLSNTRIGGTLFCRAELRGSWGMGVSPASQAGFHVVARGTCWLRVKGRGRPLRLVQGDVILLPHGAGHSLQSDPEARVLPLFEALRQQGLARPRSPERDDSSTVLLCGAYHFERNGVHPLLSLLPPLIHIPADGEQVAGPLEAVLRLLVAESAQAGPGTHTVISRLVDVLFIHIIRCWLEQQPEGSAGWLGALKDAQVGRALARMHAEPARDWTVQGLAAEVATSRATFARRFRELVGEPPLVYLTRWRMELAGRLLRETELSLAEVAAHVGYSSEFAFNRTFHRECGQPPGRYREQARVRPLPTSPSAPREQLGT